MSNPQPSYGYQPTTSPEEERTVGMISTSCRSARWCSAPDSSGSSGPW